MVTIIYWNEPTTGKLEHGYYVGDHNKFPGWVVVLWNGKPHPVSRLSIVDRREITW